MFKRKGLRKSRPYTEKEYAALQKDILNLMDRAKRMIKSGNKKYVNNVIKWEDEIDALEKEFKRNHIERLKQKICNPEADTIFLESLRNLERISDHAYSIVLSLIN